MGVGEGGNEWVGKGRCVDGFGLRSTACSIQCTCRCIFGSLFVGRLAPTITARLVTLPRAPLTYRVDPSSSSCSPSPSSRPLLPPACQPVATERNEANVYLLPGGTVAAVDRAFVDWFAKELDVSGGGETGDRERPGRRMRRG